MIEIKIPKEITRYQAKLVGPFTARQCVTLLIFGPIIIFAYNGFSKILGSSVASYLILPIAGLAALFGWVKFYGLTFEKFLQSVFINAFVAPAKRIYKADNFYELLSRKAKELTPEEELVVEAYLENAPEDEVAEMLKQMKKNHKKPVKYKKSKKAIF